MVMQAVRIRAQLLTVSSTAGTIPGCLARMPAAGTKKKCLSNERAFAVCLNAPMRADRTPPVKGLAEES